MITAWDASRFSLSGRSGSVALKGGPGTQDGPAWVGHPLLLGASTGSSKKRSILRPRASLVGSLGQGALVSRLCRGCRRRRAGWSCSAPIPGNPSPLAAPVRLHSGELSLSLHRAIGRAQGAPRSIRIAPAPLNSVRLPSMRRRHEQYLTTLLVLILFAAETFAGFEIAGVCPPTSGFSPWGV